MKPKLLDLFCGAGGASMGYYRAGFEVVGVDIKPQPRYPFEFHQADALTYPLEGFDAYHASPPCQAYSKASKQWRIRGKKYPELIDAVRALLETTGRPYIIECVPLAPLRETCVLNGAMFGMNISRMRHFETSFNMPFILLPPGRKPIKMGRKAKPGDVVAPVGHFSGVDYVASEMELEGLTQYELSQAIPPVYTEYIGKYLMDFLRL